MTAACGEAVAVLALSSGRYLGESRQDPKAGGYGLEPRCTAFYATGTASPRHARVNLRRAPAQMCQRSSREKRGDSVRPGRHEKRPPFLVEWSARGGVDPPSVEGAPPSNSAF